MKIKERRIKAIKQLEEQISKGTKPTKKSAATSVLKGYKKIDGKYREPLNAIDISKKTQQIETLKERIK